MLFIWTPDLLSFERCWKTLNETRVKGSGGGLSLRRRALLFQNLAARFDPDFRSRPGGEPAAHVREFLLEDEARARALGLRGEQPVLGLEERPQILRAEPGQAAALPEL